MSYFMVLHQIDFTSYSLRIQSLPYLYREHNVPALFPEGYFFMKKEDLEGAPMHSSYNQKPCTIGVNPEGAPSWNNKVWNGNSESSAICQYVCQSVLLVQPIRSFNLISMLVHSQYELRELNIERRELDRNSLLFI